jgi:hypothetical protein
MTLDKDHLDDRPQDEIHSPPQQQENPALTVVIQSWTTPIAALVMLIVGLLGGYYGRPFLSPETIPIVDDGSTTSETSGAPITVPTPNAELAVQQQELMVAVVENTRHFRGEPDAPITLIEFSDFQ